MKIKIPNFQKFLSPFEAVIIFGLFIRIWFALNTNYISVYAKFRFAEAIFFGDNVLIRGAAYGPALHTFFAPMYANYLLLVKYVGNYEFFMVFLFKLPAIISDVVMRYAIYGITLHVSNEKKKAVLLSSIYFLNPYVIWTTALQGWMEHMTTAFVLLSIFYLLKGKMGLSAASLAFSMASRQFPVLLLPAFITYLWMKYRLWSPNVKRFGIAFIISAAIINSPYIYIMAKLATKSFSAFIMYPSQWFGTATTSGHAATTFDFPYNFTGVLSSLGIWDATSVFFGGRIFLLLFTLFLIFLIKYRQPTAEWLNLNIMIIFVPFIITTPLVEPSFLQWVLPSILLASVLFRSIPWYYPHVIRISLMLIEPMSSASFTYNFDQTFPNWFPIRDPAWPFRSLPFYLSLSVLHSFFLILSLAGCFFTVYIRRKQTNLNKNTTNVINSLRNNKYSLGTTTPINLLVILLLILYSVFEILRISFGLGSEIISGITGGILIVLVWYLVYFKTNHKISFRQILRRSENIFYLGSVFSVLLTILWFKLDSSTFLVVQIAILIMFWSSNQFSFSAIVTTKISQIFTLIYVFYVMLTSLNIFLGQTTILFLISWLYFLYLHDIHLNTKNRFGEIR